jgi:hypothetical protein
VCRCVWHQRSTFCRPRSIRALDYFGTFCTL